MQVPQPKVATETRQLIKDNKKVEEVFERIGSSVVALAVSKSPSHEVVQLEILETGYFSTSVLKSSGPLRTANSAGLFVHEFDALNAGVTYTARASFQADASSTPVHSEVGGAHDIPVPCRNTHVLLHRQSHLPH